MLDTRRTMNTKRSLVKPANSAVNSQERILDIDQNCMSCCNELTFVKKSFKLACIAYKPGRILFNDQTYSRHKIIKMREEMLF